MVFIIMKYKSREFTSKATKEIQRKQYLWKNDKNQSIAYQS